MLRPHLASAARSALGALVVCSLALLLGACANRAQTGASGSQPVAQSMVQPPLFEGIGNHTRAVSTTSPDAQRYFDQALTWTFSFNHDEAIRSYQQAIHFDPDLAIAYWGIALCNGPHINNPVMDEPRARAAWDALQKAQALAPKAKPAERALITALAARYTDPARPPIPFTFDDRAPLDKAYADAMAKVYAEYPNDADIATLYAESLMDMRPWDLWDPKTKEPRPETPKVLAALEHALQLDPNHPGANHYYIHAVEASPHPEKANAAADRLRTLVPASGHMVHMPAHIDVRTGRWAQSAEQNRQATATDAKYRAISPNQGIYHFYMAHDDHFLTWACMMLGRREEAVASAQHLLHTIPPQFVHEAAAFTDPMMTVEIEALIRFGQWDQVLQIPDFPDFLPISRALRHYARACALGAQNKLEEAAREQQAFKLAAAAVPESARMAQNPAHTILDLADHTLTGELAYRRGNTSDAVSELTKAVAIEDDLRYMEPPDWFQPVRHSLGAILLADGRVDDAEKVYRADLERWPENGWSLYGLSRCLDQKKSPEAAAVKARFDKAWSQADTKLTATCLCVPASQPSPK